MFRLEAVRFWIWSSVISPSLLAPPALYPLSSFDRQESNIPRCRCGFDIECLSLSFVRSILSCISTRQMGVVAYLFFIRTCSSGCSCFVRRLSSVFRVSASSQTGIGRCRFFSLPIKSRRFHIFAPSSSFHAPALPP